MREPQRQICPWLVKAERSVLASAASKSQSEKTRVGFFPPISNDSFLKAGAAVRAISAPVRVLPVKEMPRTSGWAVNAAPTLGPSPCTRFKTPLGSPASAESRPSQSAVTGVTSEGLATTQFPAASAGATFQERR